MKAIVYTEYGPPSVLQLRQVEKPSPKDNEVLIRICAATVNQTDPIARKGEPLMARFDAGLLRPKHHILGNEFAGQIESVGRDVTLFKAGDQVFGTGTGYGAYAEYLCLPEEGATLAIMPANTTYEEAAGCDGTLTALPFLRDRGNIQSGQEVLINGASGGVGTAAVQLAKYFRAQVAGVCSTANLGLVESLGADRVIDYTKEDFTKSGETYDIVFDVASKSSFSRCKSSLKQGGIYLQTVPNLAIFLQMLWTSKIGTKKAAIAFTGLRPPSERTKDLIFYRELVEAGNMRSVIDRRYPLEQIAEAHAYVEEGHKKGNVVITVAPDVET
jgi:NADPH:quinone reductase-like Zn-dependent oxidoreductase